MVQASEPAPEANEFARKWIRRPMPRVFTKTAWRRFSSDRRRVYLADLSAPPTTEQMARIDSLVRHEWPALKAEAIGTLAADRDAREHRRLFNRLLADHTRASVVKEPPAPKPEGRKPKPGPSQLSLDEHLELLQQRGAR